MLESLSIYLSPAVISYLWLTTPISGLMQYHADRLHLKKWLVFIIDKLSCSHCVTFWTSLVMLYGLDNLLLAIFVNIVIVKLTIKYT